MPLQSNGALSENIKNYISVRFQNGIYYIAVSAIQNKEQNSLDDFFKAADYGIVGDAFEVVPKLIEAVKKFKAANA